MGREKDGPKIFGVNESDLGRRLWKSIIFARLMGHKSPVSTIISYNQPQPGDVTGEFLCDYLELVTKSRIGEDGLLDKFVDKWFGDSEKEIAGILLEEKG